MKERLEQLSQEGFIYNGSYYIKKGFDLFGQTAGQSIVVTLLYFLIMGATSLVPFSGLLIAWPLGAGFYIVAKKIDKDGGFEINDFFEGFNNFGHLFVGFLLYFIFVFLGTLLFILPGIYLGIAFSFALPILALSDIKPMDALSLSRKIISHNWLMFLFLSLFLMLLNLVGVLFIFVGLFVSIPISYYILYAAFSDILADQHEEPAYGNDKNMDTDLDQYFKDLEK
jgi:uncharacterized membrane protein